jgi:hypothetical protein
MGHPGRSATPASTSAGQLDHTSAHRARLGGSGGCTHAKRPGAGGEARRRCAPTAAHVPQRSNREVPEGPSRGPQQHASRLRWYPRFGHASSAINHTRRGCRNSRRIGVTHAAWRSARAPRSASRRSHA